MTHRCRFCRRVLKQVFADLGTAPPSNAFLDAHALDTAEVYFPLKAYVCGGCFLVQLPAHEAPEKLFANYKYFSSFSSGWLDHARAYAQEASRRRGLAGKLVIELGSNDGYLLRFFRQKGARILGIDPAANVARVARRRGVPTMVAFFGSRVARQVRRRTGGADHLVGNNVLAHVPDLNDFVEGVRILLKKGAEASFEFPHLLRLMRGRQFDTIYHEHFSYFSLLTAVKVFRSHALQVADAREIPTHGGSLRLTIRHEGETRPSLRVAALVKIERYYGLDRPEAYRNFATEVSIAKRSLTGLLSRLRSRGKRVAAYGAAAKGNTLLNYCGLRADSVEYVVDRNPHKQGLFLPGSRIPVLAPRHVMRARPDYLLILPWNLKDEIMEQMRGIRRWGGRFIIPIPRVKVL